METPTHIFALQPGKNITVCGRPGQETEHDNIIILNGRHDETFTNKRESVDLPAYINSKFLYSELRLRETVDNATSKFLNRRCNIERTQLLHKLQLARSIPEMNSHLFETPGTTARALGEVLYIGRCTEVTVTLRRTTQCYDAIPVTDSEGRALFAAAITRILVETAEPIPCNANIAPTFKIGNEWVSFSPDPRIQQTPNFLSPEVPESKRLSVMSHISTAGLHTSQEMEALSRLMTHAATRIAISNTVARVVTGETATETSLLNFDLLMTPQHAVNIVKSGLSSMFVWCTTAGQFVASFLGVLMILRMVKYARTLIPSQLPRHKGGNRLLHPPPRRAVERSHPLHDCPSHEEEDLIFRQHQPHRPRSGDAPHPGPV